MGLGYLFVIICICMGNIPFFKVLVIGKLFFAYIKSVKTLEKRLYCIILIYCVNRWENVTNGL